MHTNSLVQKYDFIFFPLLSDGPRFILSIGVVHELWRTCAHWAGQDELLQVVEQGRVFLSEEGHCYTSFAGSASSTNAMCVVWRGYIL